MLKKNTFSFGALFLSICLGLASCKAQNSSDEVLAGAIKKIENSQGIEYQYQSNWDNRFNGSTYADSAKIHYAKITDGFHGFGFYAKTSKNELVFDGKNYIEIRHAEKTIVRHDTADIKADADYFSSMAIFTATPFELDTSKKFNAVFDTIINNQDYYVYQVVVVNPSFGDTTKRVRQERLYYVDPNSRLVQRIQSISILELDTLQVIDHYFTAVKLYKAPQSLLETEQAITPDYREISIHDLDNELHLKQVVEGHQLKKTSYKDINGQEVTLFGIKGSQSIIMFSYIGCGGCEYAMQQMIGKKFRIKQGIRLYYCSPVDKKASLNTYVYKKGFPFNAFSIESKMNDDFSVYAFPTFVLIDAEGLVEKVFGGYGEEVRAVLFDSE